MSVGKQATVQDRQIETSLRRRSVLKRVLHIINGEDYSGAERVQDLLAMRLPEFGYEVHFVCLKPGRFDVSRASQRVPLSNLPMRTKFDLKPARRVVQLVKQGGFSAIHSHSTRTLLIGRPAAAIARVPIIHHVQSPSLAGSTEVWRNRTNTIIERVMLTGVDHIVAVSDSLKRYLRRQAIAAERIDVIPNAVPVRGPLSERALPREPWTIGICAMFRPRKGIEVLLEALSELRQRDISFRLRAVGYFQTPEYETHIKRMASDLGLERMIDWRGFSEDVYEELAQMDIFVLPSLFGEGLPLAILEAMAAGVPVVSTDVEGTPEAVRNEIDGLIVEPRDSAALAKAFQRVIQGDVDWHAMRASAHQRQGERYSDRKMAQDVAQVYDRVLGRRGCEKRQLCASASCTQ
jgi:glycosyltransferase involved in cell wall biosynthesis